MIKKKILCVIPARGGSKSIKNKNLLKLGKYSLVEHAIIFAKNSKKFTNIVLSSDSDKILDVGLKNKINVIKRSKINSSDKSLVADTIHEILTFYKKKNLFFDVVVLLEPTCPFRKMTHLKSCLNILINKKLDSIATFNNATLNPNRGWKIKNNIPVTYFKNVIPWNNKQSFDKAYQLNGSVYAFSTANFKPTIKSLLFGKSFAFICKTEDILIDIDNKNDYLISKLLFNYEKNKKY
jgi:CMP-N,N'-diacetyllegionaminic acid synthase